MAKKYVLTEESSIPVSQIPLLFTYMIPFGASLTKSNPDSNGVYLTYTWTLPTVISGCPAKWVSTLSSDYVTRTVTVYGSDKSTLIKTITFTRTFDSNGNLITETASA